MTIYSEIQYQDFMNKKHSVFMFFCDRNMRNDVQRRSDDSMVSASVPPRNMYQHNSRLGMRIQEELKRDSYDVVLDPPTAACMGTLPWWRL